MLGLQHSQKAVSCFVADMCFCRGHVQIRPGVKGQHPQGIVHYVKRFFGQKWDLSPVVPAPQATSEMPMTPEVI